MKWIVSVVCWLLAIAVFYAMFFKLAPYTCGLIPVGQWQALLKVAVYFIIACFGGIGLPFVLILWGVFHIPEE